MRFTRLTEGGRLPTAVSCVAELLLLSGSGVEEAIVAVLLRLAVWVGSTFTTTVKVADPTAKEGLVQFTVPVVPTVGVVQVQPEGVVVD
jgi:hypothetical protein